MKDANSLAQRRSLLTEPIVAMVLLTLLFFSPVFPHFTRYVLSSDGGDIAFSYYFLREFGFSQLRDGIVPLWNPYLYCGTPFIGDLQSALFYPLNLMFIVLPTALALNVNMLLHTFLSGLFFFLAMRALRVSRFASGLSALAFMFSTATLNRIVAGHLTDLNALPWLPALVWILIRMERSGNALWGLAGACAFACMILAGHPQFTFYFSMYLGIFIVWRLAGGLRRREWRKAGAYALLVAGIAIGGLALSAIHVLPAIEFGKYSFRAGMIDYKFCASFSFPPENFITFLFPGFFGTSFTSDYWGRFYAWEMVAYVGVLPIVFAAAALLVSTHREKIIFAVLVLLTTVLALGSYTPLFKVLYYYVPGFNLFRGTSKFIVTAVFSICVLAGMGLDAVLETPLSERAAKRLKLLAIVVLALAFACVVFIVLFSISPQRPGALWDRVLRYRATLGAAYMALPDIGAGNVRLQLWQQTRADAIRAVVLLIGSALIVLLALKGPERRGMIKTLAAVVVVVNLANFWWEQTVFYDKSILRLPTEIESVFRKDSIPHRMSATARWWSNFAMSNNVSTVFGNLSNHLRRYHRFALLTQAEGAKDLHLVLRPALYSPLYEMLGVRYALVGADQPVNLAGARAVAIGGGLTLYETAGVLPRAYLAPAVTFVHDENEAYDFISRADFSARTATVVEVPESFPQGEFGVTSAPGTAQIVRWGINGATIQARASAKSMLIVSEIYDAGWKCFVDERRAEVYPANYILLGIPLDAGEHTVVLQYAPDGYRIGRIVTFAALFIVIAAAALYLLLKHRTAISQSAPLNHTEGRGS